MQFKLHSRFKPTGDQPQAIDKLVEGIKKDYKDQTLIGVTGSGKTFTIANMVERLNKPTLIISHNKTLAAQLYQEFREFFPENAVSYFVSYYDFYQPEAFIPSSNTYIEKEADINELIDKLRLQATTNLLSRKDVLVVASVSCIYNIGKPDNYEHYTKSIKVGDDVDRKSFYAQLVLMQYSQSQFDFKRGTFRDRGENIDIYPSSEDIGVRIELIGNRISSLRLIDPLTGKTVKALNEYTLYPARLYMAGGQAMQSILDQIREDARVESKALTDQGKLVEGDRLWKRVTHDLELIKEVGYVNGIENYSRYFDGRQPGEAPYSLLEYFRHSYEDDWLLFIDESHMTIPQIGGMYNGDFSRKGNLINYGFRLKAAYDNRPLKFEEFLPRVGKTVYVSATPADWELNRSQQVVEQLVRPTGIPDPQISIRPVKNQIDDLIKEIEIRAKKKERVLVTTLTKRIAEDLSMFLQDKGVKAQYLHSDIKTLERSDVLEKLRKGEFDVLIGINLLREGLDLPEVTLVAILDADKEGFLRSKTALVQTMGRAARNVGGEVILYTDKMTKSITGAVEEVNRRRIYQEKYNKEHNIDPKTIFKPIREKVVISDESDLQFFFSDKKSKYGMTSLKDVTTDSLTGYDRKKIIVRLRRQMKKEADNLNFELAAQIRDKIKELEK
ncbi:MAG: excinuclease ABC subunit UvrB [Patescibacteria group bacterium]|jgi:excinuclease ABC subunit B